MMEFETEHLPTDLTTWVIGPYDTSLPGPMTLKLSLDGEVVAGAEMETGYLHRGLEKAFELHSWQSSVLYADRLDPEGAFFGELSLCLAVEEIAGIAVPERAQSIRAILSELPRISCHLGYAARMARAVGAETMVHYVLRDREKILDLFELLTGARFTLNFLRFGGVAADVTEGFVERVLETCELIRVRLKEYNDLFSFNQAFIKRTAFLGVIQPVQARRVGLTGPNARASGVAVDTRKERPYSGYQKLDFEITLGHGAAGTVGDTHDRFLMRLREIAQSLELLKQLSDAVPSGEFASQRIERDFVVPPGEAYARVESSRGLLGCYVVSDGKSNPARVSFRVPSLAGASIAPGLLVGNRLEDLPVILASLDIGVAEVDR